MLWTHSKLSFFLAFCWSCLFFSGSAFATVVAPTMWHTNVSGLNQNTGYSASQWCQANYPTAVSATELSDTSTVQYQQGLSQYPGISFYFRRNSTLRAQCKDSQGATVGGSYSVFKVAYCENSYPAGTAPDLTCVSCPSGTVDINGSCTPPPTCPPPGSVTYPTALDGGFFVTATSSAPNTGDSGDSFCLPYGSDLCEVKCSTGFSGPNPLASGYAVVCTSLKATGNACNVSTAPFDVTLENPLDVGNDTDGGEPDGPSDCPPGTGFASVNNQNMCLPSDTTGTAGSTSSSSSSGTTAASDSTWKIEPNGTTTTNTTNTVTVGGQTTTSNTTTNSGIKVGDGTEGQGVDFGPAPGFDSTAVEGLDPELVPGSAMPVFEPNTSLLGSSGGSCPAPIGFSAMGQDFSIPFDALCQWAAFFKAFLLIAASFAALRILVMA